MDKDQIPFWFTKYDDKITGTSQRDPLGLQPIWSYYGRNVVKHLTTVSADFRGFREVLLCLSICSKYLQNHPQRSNYKDLILIFEQLFIYSVISEKIYEGIIGADNGKAKFNLANGNPEISPTETILVNQISLGYYGRYKTPLNTMGIIDSHSQVNSNIDVTALFSELLYCKVYEAFENFMMNVGKKKRFSSFSEQDNFKEAVCGKLRDGEKEFWLEHLQISGKNQHEIMNKCYQKVAEDKNARQVLSDKEIKDDKYVKNILLLEPFLRCIEQAFYTMMNTNNINSMPEALPVYTERYNEFIGIDMPQDNVSNVLLKRIEELKKLNPNKDDYYKNIFEYHKLVCEQKHSALWFEVSSEGEIQSFMQVPDTIDIDQWERNYYLSSLRSIKEGIEKCP